MEGVNDNASAFMHLNVKIINGKKLLFKPSSVIYVRSFTTWQEHTVKCTVQISTQNAAQSLGQFGQMVECSFKN